MTRRFALVLAVVGLGLSARAQSEVVVRKDERITTRDGTKLAADVYLPARDGAAVAGRHPTLLCRTPYD